MDSGCMNEEPGLWKEKTSCMTLQCALIEEEKNLLRSMCTNRLVSPLLCPLALFAQLEWDLKWLQIKCEDQTQRLHRSKAAVWVQTTAAEQYRVGAGVRLCFAAGSWYAWRLISHNQVILMQGCDVFKRKEANLTWPWLDLVLATCFLHHKD